MTAPTSEQVIEWAQGAGFTVRNGVIKAVHSNGSWVELSERLAEFAALAFAAGQAAQGGAAFPQPCTAKGSAANLPFGIADDCMTVRDYLAAHAPVELGTMLEVYGDENADLFLDNVRASYMAILAMARYEYADAMLTEREKGRQVEVVAGKECAETKSDGWISVNDRLPEEGKECLVFTKALTPVVSNLHTHSVTVDEIDDGDWLLNSYQTVVTHWQPMPEPPKKGGAE